MARRTPQLQKAVGVALEAAGIGVGSSVANAAFESNVARLMDEHKTLSRVNAEKVLDAGNGMLVSVAGAGVEGADVLFHVPAFDLGPPTLLLQIQVKALESFSNFQGALRDAAGSIQGGGGVFLQVPNGTTLTEVNRRLNGFRLQPNRDPKKYQNMYLEVHTEDGELLYHGGIF